MGQSIFSNVIIATLSRVAVIFLGLAATALMVRTISVEAFGVYSLVLTIGTVLQLVADFGLYLTASRELGTLRGQKSDVISHIVSLRICLLGGVFALGLLGFFVVPSMRTLMELFIILSAGLIFQSISQLLMGVFQAYGSMWKANIGDIVGRTVQVALLSSFVFFPLSQIEAASAVIAIACAFMAGLLVALLIHIILVPYRSGLFPKVSLSAWRSIMRSSWPIGLMLILNVLYFRIDIILLSLFRSEQEVGLYSFAYKIIENGLFFPAMLGGLLLPHISSALAGGRSERARTLLSQGLTLSFYGGSIIILVLVVFAGPIISFIGGQQFLQSVPLLRVLAIALAIMFIGNIFGFTLIALQQQYKLLLLYGVLVCGNLALNLLLIPGYGAIAASWITVATEGAAMLAASYIVYRKLTWNLPVFLMMLALGAAALSVYVGWILPAWVHIVPRLLIVGALYYGMGYCLGLWSKSTLQMLRSVSSI